MHSSWRLSGFFGKTETSREGYFSTRLRKRLSTISLKQLYVALPLFAYQILINLFFFYEICFRINPYSTFLPMLFQNLFTAFRSSLFLYLSEFLQFVSFSVPAIGILAASAEMPKASVPLVRKNLRAVLSDIILLNLLVVVLWFILRLLCQIIIVVVVNFLRQLT